MTEEDLAKTVALLPPRLTMPERVLVARLVGNYRAWVSFDKDIDRMADVVEKLLIYHDRFVALLPLETTP